MSFLLRAIGFGSSGIPNFPFQLGAEVRKVPASTIHWTMREGTRNEDNMPVTIFELACATASQDMVDMARNVVKRAKTLMLPGFLRCYDAVEYNGTVYVATEECVPLSLILGDEELKLEYYEDKDDKFLEGVALGLRHVAQGLAALNGNLVHGNVSDESVYVLKSGEWRLFGLEFVAGCNEDQTLFQRYWSLLPDYRRPPETLSGSATSSSSACSSSMIDAWGIGALIYAVFSQLPPDRLKHAKGAEMRTFRTLPRSLQSGFTGLTATNPKLRMPISKFLEDSEFIVGSEYVQCLQQLDELALKDATDRDAVYRRLVAVVDTFPIRACKYIILSKLSVAVQYGGGSATALEPILKIGARLSDPVVFAELVAPIVMTLFASQDPLVRIRLLTSAGQYARLLPPALVNDKIWAPFVSGFTSTNANMRELTVRALVHFAPLLNEKNFSNDVVKYITLLQQDREGPIRTNATICLCLIAEHVPEAIRAKTLVHGFGRMLKDPFLPSRIAALRSIHTTLPHYAPGMIAEMIIPGVAPLSLDPSSPEIRQIVFKILDSCIESLKTHSSEMPAPPPAPTGSSTSNDEVSNGSGVGLSNLSTPTAPGGSASSPPPAMKHSGSGFWGWGGGSQPNTPSQPSQQPSGGATTVHKDATAIIGGNTTTAPTQNVSHNTTTAAAPSSSSLGSWEDALDDEPIGATTSVSTSAAKPAVPLTASATASSGGGLKLKKKGLGGATKVE